MIKWDTTLQSAGSLQWNSSNLNDPFIKRALDFICKSPFVSNILQENSMTEQDLIALIDGWNQHEQKFLTLSPELCGTVAQNNIETIVFQMCWALTANGLLTIPGASKFSSIVFDRLARDIQSSRPSFFKMKSFIQRVPLARPVIAVYDNDLVTNEGDYNKFTQCPTAYATPDGVFVFNKQFCQALINWAYIKQIKPKHYFFKSRGGDIPDDYAYLEFLIFHEFLHYTDDDFFYQKIIPNAKGKIINYVGDFRINYKLVKNGMEQLPLGLFSDKINFDRYNDYEEVYGICDNLLKQAWLPEVGMPVTDDNGGKGVITAIHPNGDIETEDIATDEEMLEAYEKFQIMQQMKLARFGVLRALMNADKVKDMKNLGEAK